LLSGNLERGRELTVRIGLIGAGIMGADHARAITANVGGAALAAVHDTDMERARSVARASGDARVLDTAEQVVADPKVDAVLIASPDPTHAPLTLACIAAGKPVLVEKPLAATLEEGRAVVTAEMKAGRRLVQVGFMRRFDPGYVAMKETLAGGRLGAPLFFHCVHRNAVGPDYLTSELVIANAAIHEMDIARFVLEDEFAWVSVTSPRASSRAPKRQPQLLVLETRSGVVVDVEAFVDAGYGYEVRGEMVCESGTILLNPNPAIATREAGHERTAVDADWRGRFQAAYRDQLISWVETIKGGKPKGSSAWDGYAASVTAAACLDAWRSRTRTEVQLEERPGFYR
jgi:myo-inositol 2-dehydrogenase / D-chiro-inositol 1-dehydrogenase